VKALLAAFLIGLVAAVQAACAGTPAGIRISADPLLVSVLSIAALCGGGAAVLAAAFAGICRDALSTGPFGVSSAVFIPLAVLQNRLRLPRGPGYWAVRSAAAFAGTLAASALYLLFTALRGEPAYVGPGPLLATALVNACIAPPLHLAWRAVLR
jgi:cell shape-determining protein MreD